MITVIGIFDNQKLAEEAGSYLLANEFENWNVDIHTHGTEQQETNRIDDFFGHVLGDRKQAEHYALLARQGSVVTIHAASTREAQEAVDVFNQYGAVKINAAEAPAEDGASSLVFDQIIPEGMRLRSQTKI